MILNKEDILIKGIPLKINKDRDVVFKCEDGELILADCLISPGDRRFLNLIKKKIKGSQVMNIEGFFCAHMQAQEDHMRTVFLIRDIV